MSFPPYPKYKDSGVEWLGEVPEHWNNVPLWTCFKRQKRTGHGSEELLSVYRDFGVIPKSSRDDNFNKPSDDLDAYQLVEEGDLVINKMKAWQGSVAVSEYKGIVSPAYFVYTANHNCNSKYFHHLMRSMPYIDGYLMISKGIRINQWDLQPEYHSRMPILTPPLPEQQAIATFLDRETAKIDALIAEQRRLIELLKEKRQAVISHAVTKGLNPSAPMKDSGIEWLGTVPEHWEVVPFGFAIKYQEGPGILASDFHDEGVPLLRLSGAQGRWATLDGCNYLDPEKVAKRWNHFRLSLGDLIISCSASMGTVTEVGEEAVGAIPYTGLMRLVPNDGKILSDYIRSIVVSDLFSIQIDHLKAGATIQHFGPTHLRQVKVVLPPLSEQASIAEHILSEQNAYDTLTTQAEQSITLLQERRSALISAAVTGKIDVRGVVGTGDAA